MKKILVVVTNHMKYEKKERNTGLWLGELVYFIEPIEKAGFSYDIVSPNGGNIPLDPESLKGYATDKSIKAFYGSQEKMGLLKNTKSINEVRPENYAAIYFTGGHGTMWDFPNNELLQKAAQIIYEQGGIVSAVCHGVSGLLNIKLSNGSLLINGKTVTGYSDFEEVLAGVAKQVPFSLQSELKARGAYYQKAFLPFVPYVRQSDRLITGQNPFSTKAVAKNVIETLSK